MDVSTNNTFPSHPVVVQVSTFADTINMRHRVVCVVYRAYDELFFVLLQSLAKQFSFRNLAEFMRPAHTPTTVL